MFDKMGSFADMLQNIAKLREGVARSAEALGQLHVEGTAGGDAVMVRMNGRLEVERVRIDPRLLADGDGEVLEDLLVAAYNQASARAREAVANHIQSTTGLTLPPGMPNPFGG